MRSAAPRPPRQAVPLPQGTGYTLSVSCDCGNQGSLDLDLYVHLKTFDRVSRALRCTWCGRRGPFASARLHPSRSAIRGLG
jgi:hypothetical protein